LAALYITSPEVGAGRTTVSAGIAKYLKDDGKKIGYFKPLFDGADDDGEFMKKALSLAEPVGDISPKITKSADVIKKAYAKVSSGKKVVIVEGAYEPSLASALEAKVVIVVSYSDKLAKAKFADFGSQLLGVVVNKVPVKLLSGVREEMSKKSGVAVLDVLPEDRVLLGLTVGELAEVVGGEIMNNAEKSAEVVESLMLGAMTIDSGPSYFGRKINKAAVIRGGRPDMQLAALETSTRCLVISGDGELIHAVRKSAEEKAIPIILAKGDTAATVASIEKALGKARFNQEKKLTHLSELMQTGFDFKALYKGLGL
jgi:BioD-like phosphotransacetylase family protein